MSDCAKCGGLVVDEYGEVRCLNCGWRGEATMPKFRSKEAEERWREGIRLAAERRREAKGKPVTAASPPPGQTTPSDCLHATLRLIDDKIVELQALRRDLERSAGLWLER